MVGTRARPVNNAIYDGLDERWYGAQDDPVALLRAETACRAPWIASRIRTTFGDRPVRVLDVGCGAGFLANHLAQKGLAVTGVDMSPASLVVAQRHDPTRSVRYAVGDARQLSFAAGSFDVVCAMDLLEHVEEPAAVIAEIARVLVPHGLFFFHTFNRNLLSWLVVIKGVEWFVRNTPHNLHVLRLFLKPKELVALSRAHGLDVTELHGVSPEVTSCSFWRLVATGVVPSDFRFRFTRSIMMGYSGLATKTGPVDAS